MSSPGSPLAIAAGGHTLIVGAGPTGLALALALVERGLPVTLVERQTRIGVGFRGEALMPSGLKALQGLGLMPLQPQVRQRALQGWSFWLQGRPLFAAEEPMGAPDACTLLDPQTLLQSWAERLQQAGGARLLTGSSVASAMESDGRIRGVRLGDGQELTADLVVACDGRHSALRRAADLSLGRQSRPIDVLWFQLGGPSADTLAERLAGRFHTLIGDAGSLALFASAGGGVQLGWPLAPEERPARSLGDWRQRWLALCPPPIAEALAALPESAIEGPLRLPVQVGLATRWWRPGLLLLGDAAHPMSPVRAQGTSMALRDVLVAAALLPQALRLSAAGERQAALDAALATLEARRRPEIRRIQALQEQEWQRGVRLGHSPPLRRLLAALAPLIGPALGQAWSSSQRQLRQGLPDGICLEPS